MSVAEFRTDENVRPTKRQFELAVSSFAATRLIVRTTTDCLPRVLLGGNTVLIASYVADGDDSEGGRETVPDSLGATGRKCLCALLGNRMETHRRVRGIVDNKCV